MLQYSLNQVLCTLCETAVFMADSAINKQRAPAGQGFTLRLHKSSSTPGIHAVWPADSRVKQQDRT